MPTRWSSSRLGASANTVPAPCSRTSQAISSATLPGSRRMTTPLSLRYSTGDWQKVQACGQPVAVRTQAVR